MATPTETTPTTTPTTSPGHSGLPTVLPRLREILLRVLISVATAVLAPAVLLWATLVLFNFTAAVLAALAWIVAAMGWRRATHRPISGLLLLTLVVLAVRTMLSLATGSTFFYFVQPVFADVVVATLFLGSLWTAQPVVARIAPDFYPLDANIAARPRMHSLFRHLTLMWGLVILIKAAVTFVLLQSLATTDFVLIKGAAITVLTTIAALVSVLWAVLIGRREGLLRAD